MEQGRGGRKAVKAKTCGQERTPPRRERTQSWKLGVLLMAFVRSASQDKEKDSLG